MKGTLPNNLRLEGVKVIFKNFKGEERKYNRQGARNFNAVIDNSLAEKLEGKGWKMRWLEPRREGDERRATIKVNINFSNPNHVPNIIMVIGKKMTQLDEEAVSCLDSAEIDTADLVLTPYNYDPEGDSPVSAYLKSGYFNVIEDEFYDKYHNDDDDVPI